MPVQNESPGIFFRNFPGFRIVKPTTIRRTTVRETAVSQDHGGPILEPPEASLTSKPCVSSGLRGPPLCRDAGLSDSQFIFFELADIKQIPGIINKINYVFNYAIMQL